MTAEITYEVRICIQCGRVWLGDFNPCPTCKGITDEFAEISHLELINRLGLPDWRP